ncbi:MAG: hypothetical protein CSA95_05445 [Bacteroidetes bacterium]|nr:MAG: hypothetical protein CSA95_05445 [Bacteroidota bacterium]PIE88724.1 MAG: hypothetical protein CSA04_00410 [Bacteroidota bacterium]
MKLLILLSRVPWPVEKGDKLRAFHQVRCLSELHEIHLFALTNRKNTHIAKEKLSKYCKSITIVRISIVTKIWYVFLALLTGKPLQNGLFYSRKAKKRLATLVEQVQPDHLYCQLIRVADLAKTLSIPCTIDYQDAMSTNMLRRKKASPLLMKPVMDMEYRRLVNYEQKVYHQFDHHTIISLPDKNLMPCRLKDSIHLIPNGVDYTYFSPMEGPKEVDIVFTGNMGYPPNIDACEFLIQEIIPLVKQRIEGVNVMLAGANPHPRVQRLASPTVEVTGWVDDIRDCYARSRVFVAPMRIGTGLQNKLLEAMAMQIPCITTPLANSALGGTHGENILVGETAQEIADQLVMLLSHKEKATAMGRAGHQFVRQHFSWEESSKQLSRIMSSTTQQKP